MNKICDEEIAFQVASDLGRETQTLIQSVRIVSRGQVSHYNLENVKLKFLKSTSDHTWITFVV